MPTHLSPEVDLREIDLRDGEAVARSEPAAGVAVDWVDPDVFQQLLGGGASTMSTPEALAVRIGIASIFVVNAIVAGVHPEEFTSVLRANLVGGRLPDGLLGPMVVFAGLNDLALGAAILSGRQRKLVFAWMAAWVVLVGGLKLMNLIW